MELKGVVVGSEWVGWIGVGVMDGVGCGRVGSCSDGWGVVWLGQDVVWVCGVGE